MANEPITTGRNGMGLRWAQCGEYRVVAYTNGGYCCQRYMNGPGWCLFPEGESMPEDVERALCSALGIEMED
jgi:hypothetical protein